MAEVFIDPKKFQGQIDGFASGAESIKALKYSLDKQGVRLQSIERYLECIEQYNETIKLFGEMMDKDTQSMREIKAKWMGLDSDLATKTLGQILFGD